MPRITMTRHELRAWRERHGMNQTELGKLVDRSRRTVAYWEAGEVLIPSWLPRILDTYQGEMK